MSRWKSTLEPVYTEWGNTCLVVQTRPGQYPTSKEVTCPMAEFTTDVLQNEYAIKLPCRYLWLYPHTCISRPWSEKSVLAEDGGQNGGSAMEVLRVNRYWGHTRYLDIFKTYYKVSHWEKNSSWRVLENIQNENKKRIYGIYDWLYSDKQSSAR